MAKSKRQRPRMIEHSVDVRVADGVNVNVTVFAPVHFPLWKLTRLAAIKLGLMDKPTKKRRTHQKHAVKIQ